MNNEEYYNQSDSAYLRIQYSEESGTFRIILRNEMLIATDINNEGATFVGNIARGLLELGYSDPARVHMIGHNSTYRDLVMAASDDLNEEQKDAWFKPMDNESIN